MATPIPAALKAADIQRFVFRAAQLEKPKPIIAYWCNFFIINQILSKGLQNTDQECMLFATEMMDKLEQFKNEHVEEPAVIDDVAGKAYVEQFGLETFARADNAVRANKATRQTADTFQASATFLDLLQVWGPIEPEITSKIKFAKYHALRIAKAIKAGEDPNLSNPKPEPEEEESLPALDPNDAEVQLLQGEIPTGPRQPSVTEIPDESDRLQRSLAQKSILDESLHPSRDPSVPPPINTKARQPSVVEVRDDTDRIQRELARQSSLDESLHPSRAPSNPPPNDVSPIAATDPATFYANENGHPDVSPLDTPPGRKPSIGGNYFPIVSQPTAPVPDLPSAPVTDAASPFNLPSAPSGSDLPPPPTSLNQPSSQTDAPPSQTHVLPPGPLPQAPPVQPHPFPQSRAPAPAPAPAHTVNVPQHQTPSIPPAVTRTIAPAAPVAAPPANVVLDEEAMMKAQKHARWAISALNFEDVPTAIRELRGALASLGAT